MNITLKSEHARMKGQPDGELEDLHVRRQGFFQE